MVMTLTTMIVGILAVMIKVREALMVACKKQAFFMGTGFIRLVVLTAILVRDSPQSHNLGRSIVLIPGFLGSPTQDGGRDFSACSLINLLCRLRRW